ncbi:MAG: hypothetical protein WDZ59_03120, partial [Pirellulales bacterium]
MDEGGPSIKPGRRRWHKFQRSGKKGTGWQPWKINCMLESAARWLFRFLRVGRGVPRGMRRVILAPLYLPFSVSVGTKWIQAA